ncbi:MAG: FlgD immunoglobulin-like domain containing protein [Smithella sp.]
MTTAINTSTLTSSTATTTSSSSSMSSLTADDFLTLLLTELENQDPTDPVDSSTMISEFSSLTQVTQLEQTNEYLASLVDSMSATNNSAAVSYLGRTVTYDNNEITVSDASATSTSFTLASGASDVTATIYDSAGNKVKSIDLGETSAGTYSLNWDGTNSSGNTVDDGTYTIKYSATDSSGNSISITTGGNATVTGIVYENGTAYLVTANGNIALSSVTGVSS